MYRTLRSLLLLMLVSLPRSVNAFPVPESHPFPLVCVRADFVVVARVESFVPDPATPPTQDADDLTKFYWLTSMKPAGITTFSIIRLVQGVLPDSIALHLPIVSRQYYQTAKFSIEPGQKVLLLLSKTTDGLEPTDPTTPMIPLAQNVILPAKSHGDVSSTKVETEIVDLLLSSCKDKDIRRIDTMFLRSMENWV